MISYPVEWNALADALEARTGCPAEFALAVAIHESGGGRNTLTQTKRNPFSIKDNQGQRYRKFRTVEEAFGSFGYLFEKSSHEGYVRARALYADHGMSPAFFNAFGRQYCPHEWQAWAEGVSKIYAELCRG